MINKFLKAEHWQLFLVGIAIPFVLEIVLFRDFFQAIEALAYMMESTGDVSPSLELPRSLIFVPIIILLAVGVQIGWLWSVVVGLEKKLPQDMYHGGNTLFKMSLFAPVVTFLYAMYIMYDVMNSALVGMIPNIGGFFLLFPLSFFSMFGIVYVVYFAAKRIKTVELQAIPRFEDWIVDFLLIAFFPIGVWILQPRINTLYENHVAENDTHEVEF
ncbi:MAG: hypothetical protein AB8G11_24445 [Saprospiraceae bacterium]